MLVVWCGTNGGQCVKLAFMVEVGSFAVGGWSCCQFAGTEKKSIRISF